MINLFEVVETNDMITKENLDVRTITMGIGLMDCIDSDLGRLREKIYNKIYDAAKSSTLLHAAPPTRAMGVTEIRLLTMGIPNSLEISSPVFTRSFAAS